MNTDSLQIGKAINLMMRTMPIILIRLGASIAFWVAAIIYLAIAGFVAALIGSVIEFLGVIIFLVAVIGIAPLYNLAYRYVFFLIKAAHIAVISELLVNGDLPDGTNQLQWGKQRVTERFGEANVMFVVDELVNGVVNAFTRTVYSVARMLPGDTLDALVKVLNVVIRFAMSYIDEAILARSFYKDTDENVWENARDGIVLYAMSWKPILMNAVALMIISYIPFIVVFLLFSAPVGALISFFASAQAAGIALIATLVLAWLVKVAIGDSFAMAAMIATYHRETQDLTPDPNMTARLDSLSDKFTELKERAMQSFKGKPKEEAKNDFDLSPQPTPDVPSPTRPEPASPQTPRSTTPPPADTGDTPAPNPGSGEAPY